MGKQAIITAGILAAAAAACYIATRPANQQPSKIGQYQPVNRNAPPLTDAERAEVSAFLKEEETRSARYKLTPDQIKELAELEHMKESGGEPREMSY